MNQPESESPTEHDGRFVGLIVALAAMASFAGPDHGQYLKWSQAVSTANIEALSNSLGLTAVTGVPFSTWAAGPGLLLAPLTLVLRPLGLESGAGMIAGYMAAIVCWSCLFMALKRLSSDFMATAGCIMAFIATPLGYYTQSISSEVYAMAVACYLLLQCVNMLTHRPVSLWGTACATSMLLMFRSYFGVYAWPALFVVGCGLLPSTKNVGGWDIRRLATYGLSVTLLIAAAIGQIAVVNAWMTGSPTASAYAFGDAGFQSLDRSSPYCWHVLLDVFHGLLPTHPFVVIGHMLVVALVIRAVVRRRWLEAAGWSLYFVAFVINVYIQGCYFYWWSAMGSVGVRGLVLTGIASVAAWTRSVWLLSQSSSRWPRIWRATLLTVSGLCAGWSWFHLAIGPSDFVTLQEVLGGYAAELATWSQPRDVALLAISLVVSVTLLKPHLAFDRTIGWMSAVMGALVVGSLLRYLEINPPNLAFVSWTVVLFVLQWQWSGDWRCDWEQRVVSRGIVAWCGLMLFGFSVLASSVDCRPVAASASPQVYNFPDARCAYFALAQVPRFRDQQDQLLRFFERRHSDAFLRQLQIDSQNPPVTLNFYNYRRRPTAAQLAEMFDESGLQE